jgi:hypothetical protein
MTNAFSDGARRVRGMGLLTLLCAIIVSFLSPTALYAQRRSSGRALAVSGDSGEQEAAKFWSHYIASCGESHYLRTAPGVFVELRGFHIQLRYDTLTEADRLNGVEAKGRSWFEASAYRTYSNSAWHAWGNGIPEDVRLTSSVRFQKSRGRWNFSPSGYFNDFAGTVTCSDIPGSGGRVSETPTNSILIDDYHNYPIQSFIFWDSNTNEVGTRFPQSLPTFINWKITYQETSFWYQLPPVESRWYKDGQEWGYGGAAYRAGGGSGVISSGKGWEEPGHWEVGAYTVKLYLRKKLVAVGTFQVVPDDQLPKKLRFDGFYRLRMTSGFVAWFRFYEDGSYLTARTPNDVYDDLDRMGVCLSTVRNLYTVNCDDFDIQGGGWALDINKKYVDWRTADGGKLITFGKDAITYNLIIFGQDTHYTFVKAHVLCPQAPTC